VTFIKYHDLCKCQKVTIKKERKYDTAHLML